jgi:hypothetical protein
MCIALDSNEPSLISQAMDPCSTQGLAMGAKAIDIFFMYRLLRLLAQGWKHARVDVD